MNLPTIEHTRADLANAWRAWDNAPGHPDKASAAEVAFGNHAAHFGLRGGQFRDIASAYRRSHFTREQCIAAIEAGCGHVHPTPAERPSDLRRERGGLVWVEDPNTGNGDWIEA